MRKLFLIACVGALTACTPTTEEPSKSKPTFTFTRSAKEGVAAYRRVSARVEPVAEKVCRSLHPDKSRGFCDFQVKINDDPRQPPNAYQSIGKDGRPTITFNINILRGFKNDHEIAFVFGHEAGHQIARHLDRTRSNATAGAILGGILVAVAGGDANVGVEIGANIGARGYSKKYELQADTIGAHIADRAGYNPAIGAKTFERTGGGSSALFATHPPSTQRKARVAKTVQEINAAKAQGKRAPITW